MSVLEGVNGRATTPLPLGQSLLYYHLDQCISLAMNNFIYHAV